MGKKDRYNGFQLVWMAMGTTVGFLWTSGPIYQYPCSSCTMVTQPNPSLKVYTFWLFPVSDCQLIARVRHVPYTAWSIPTRTLQVSSQGEKLDYLNTTYSQDLKGKVQAQVPIRYSLRTVSVTPHMTSSHPDIETMLQ